MTFATSLKPDQALQNGPDLDPDCFKTDGIPECFFFIFKNIHRISKGTYAKVTQHAEFNTHFHFSAIENSCFNL